MKILLLLTLFFACNAFASNKQVQYEPEKVELSGRLDLQTFPGPPNYYSIKSGDEIEQHFYLVLDHPVDVISSKENKTKSMNIENFYNVKICQLVVGEDKDWTLLRQSGEGGKVKIRGTLFQRFTGHHHSRVLLTVESVSPIF